MNLKEQNTQQLTQRIIRFWKCHTIYSENKHKQRGLRLVLPWGLFHNLYLIILFTLMGKRCLLWVRFLLNGSSLSPKNDYNQYSMSLFYCLTSNSTINDWDRIVFMRCKRCPLNKMYHITCQCLKEKRTRNLFRH